jgi:DNA invertase Pin-like site-specific DNA recombinase
VERQKLQTEATPHTTVKSYDTEYIVLKVGTYLRLSKEDDLHKDESISIENQRRILEKYCVEHRLKIVDVYVDDGYTGANFDRPNFRRMVADIESGKINCVITKDLSRFGRNHLQAGIIVEDFTNNNIRFIAVDDGIDNSKSDSANDIMMPIKNLFNEWHVRDTSKKVRSVFKRMMLDGKFIGGQAPYGYKKHPDDKHKLIIDEEVADNIRKIYRLSLEGKGSQQIANEINASHILTPSAYVSSKGKSRYTKKVNSKPESYKYQWGLETITSILKDEVYIGSMVNHKHENISFKIKKQRAIRPENRIVVQNTHEPIIGKEDFETVQKLRSARYKKPRHTYNNIFKRVLFCKECGHRLSIIGHETRTLGFKVWYRCARHYNKPHFCPKGTTIEFDQIAKIVDRGIKSKIAEYLNDDAIPATLAKKTNDTAKNDRLKIDRQKAANRIATIKHLMRKLYEDYSADILAAANYQDFLKEYQSEQMRLERVVAEIDKKFANDKDEISSYKLFKEKLAEFVDYAELNGNIVNQLIERVEISPKRETDGRTVQEVDIIYRFIGK